MANTELSTSAGSAVDQAQLVEGASDNVAVVGTTFEPAQTSYPVGSTEVVVTVADEAGNEGSCTATVTVTGKTTKSDMEKKWNVLRAAPLKRLHHLH